MCPFCKHNSAFHFGPKCFKDKNCDCTFDIHRYWFALQPKEKPPEGHDESCEGGLCWCASRAKNNKQKLQEKP
jgi:hypothetical protein